MSVSFVLTQMPISVFPYRGFIPPLNFRCLNSVHRHRRDIFSSYTSKNLLKQFVFENLRAYFRNLYKRSILLGCFICRYYPSNGRPQLFLDDFQVDMDPDGLDECDIC